MIEMPNRNVARARMISSLREKGMDTSRIEEIHAAYDEFVKRDMASSSLERAEPLASSTEKLLAVVQTGSFAVCLAIFFSQAQGDALQIPKYDSFGFALLGIGFAASAASWWLRQPSQLNDEDRNRLTGHTPELQG